MEIQKCAFDNYAKSWYDDDALGTYRRIWRADSFARSNTVTHEVAAKPQHLSDIVPDDMFVGTSLILRQGGRFLYGLRPPRAEGSRQILELTGIGGGVEDEDESLVAGALREAQEEIGCAVRVLLCSETIIVRGQDDVEWVTLRGEERPAAVVFRYYRTPPHQPWHEDNQGEACLVVYLAELDGRPWPAMELPALIWLKPTHILETAHRDIPLSTLLSSGAELVLSGSEFLPEHSWVRMTDSQEALALALKDDGLSFYGALREKV
jgi:8-oxo-dGTP pyrophosphatase MutT (NUDIX family)